MVESWSEALRMSIDSLEELSLEGDWSMGAGSSASGDEGIWGGEIVVYL